MRRTAWLLGLLSARAAAHPIDEVVQGAYLTLAPGELWLELDVTAGVEVADIVLRALDANADEQISDAEANAYASEVLIHSIVSLDGDRVQWRLAAVTMPPFENIKLAGETIKIHALAKRADEVGAHTLTFENRYDPWTSRCFANVFLAPAGGREYLVRGQRRSDDGRRLTVRYTVAES